VLAPGPSLAGGAVTSHAPANTNQATVSHWQFSPAPQP